MLMTLLLSMLLTLLQDADSSETAGPMFLKRKGHHVCGTALMHRGQVWEQFFLRQQSRAALVLDSFTLPSQHASLWGMHLQLPNAHLCQDHYCTGIQGQKCTIVEAMLGVQATYKGRQARKGRHSIWVGGHSWAEHDQEAINTSQH